MIMGECGLKYNRIDYSHRVCVRPSGKEKKEECEFVDSLYVSSGNLHMRRKRSYKKIKLVWTGVVLFWERRADIELRGVGASCRVVLFWELVRVAELARSSDPLFFMTISYKFTSKNVKVRVFRNGCSNMSISLLSLFVRHDGTTTMGLNLRSLGFKYIQIIIYYYYIFRFLCFYCFFKNLFRFVYFRKSIEVVCLGDIICWNFFSVLVNDLLCILQNFVIFDMIL